MESGRHLIVTVDALLSQNSRARRVLRTAGASADPLEGRRLGVDAARRRGCGHARVALGPRRLGYLGVGTCDSWSWTNSRVERRRIRRGPAHPMRTRRVPLELSEPI